MVAMHCGAELIETGVKKLFERYEQLFNKCLGDGIDMEEVSSLYASEFIAASSAGVLTGRNDDQLKQVMAQGYAHYRAIGTKEMRIRGLHCAATFQHLPEWGL
jgi:hypothetical protein